MVRQRVGHRAVGLDGYGDAVGHREAHLLAEVVEAAHDLAGQPFPAQGVVDLEVEGDGPPAFLGQRVGVVAGGADLDVAGLEALAGHLDVAVGLELRLQRRSVGGREGLLDLVDPRAEARAEGPEVGHHGPRHEA